MADVKQNNKGFSIIELIIVVSILALAAVPLMKSMSMSTRVNAKAQSIQNATSLAEYVMEDVKSSVSKIAVDHAADFSDGVYEYELLDQSSTQGETFDVLVTINTKKYATPDTSLPAQAQNVKIANTYKLPKIEEIDTLSQAVLTSKKELNRYDDSAQTYFNERKADYDPSDPTTAATISTKTIDIVKDTVVFPAGVSVKATVTYTDSDSNKYVRDLYSGSFVPELKDGSTDQYKPLDSNIYIFYEQGCVAETINITDNSRYTNPENPDDFRDSHRVYFVRQNTIDTSPTVNLKRVVVKTIPGEGTESKTFSHSFTFSESASSLDAWHEQEDNDMELITNVLGGSAKGIYKEEARTRIYDITVTLRKNPDTMVYAQLNSTVTASDAPISTEEEESPEEPPEGP